MNRKGVAVALAIQKTIIFPVGYDLAPNNTTATRISIYNKLIDLCNRASSEKAANTLSEGIKVSLDIIKSNNPESYETDSLLDLMRLSTAYYYYHLAIKSLDQNQTSPDTIQCLMNYENHINTAHGLLSRVIGRLQRDNHSYGLSNWNTKDTCELLAKLPTPEPIKLDQAYYDIPIIKILCSEIVRKDIIVNKFQLGNPDDLKTIQEAYLILGSRILDRKDEKHYLLLNYLREISPTSVQP